jgi:hypothetical protein
MTSLITPAIVLSASILAGCAANEAPTKPGNNNGKADGAGSDDGTFAPAPHREFPLLEQGLGTVMTDMELVTIVTPETANATKLFAFGDALVQSDWFEQMGGEYGVGPARGSYHLVGPEPTESLTNRPAYLAYLDAALASDPAAPRPDGHTMYVEYLPCSSEGGGHHTAYGTLGDALAIIDQCDGIGMAAASHEIAEAVTDTSVPQPSGGYVDGFRLPKLPDGTPMWPGAPWLTYNLGWDVDVYQPNVENADLCGGTHMITNGFLYQRSFSNVAAMAGGDPCVPALPIPYYSTTTEQDWYAGAEGSTVTIPITGWSTAPTADWQVTASVMRNRPALAYSANVDATTMNNGGTTNPRGHDPGDGTARCVGVDRDRELPDRRERYAGRRGPVPPLARWRVRALTMAARSRTIRLDVASVCGRQPSASCAGVTTIAQAGGLVATRAACVAWPCCHNARSMPSSSGPNVARSSADTTKPPLWCAR